MGNLTIIHALLPLVLKSEGGARTIVNVMSAMSHIASMSATGYNISELAIDRVTEEVAETYGDEGVLAYAVHPDIVATVPPEMSMASTARAWAVDDVRLCGAFLLWLVKERRSG